MMKYKSIVVTKRGGLEVIQIVENDLRPPVEGEARIRILATAVCQDDVAIRVGNRPFLKKPPFVPGYAFVGSVEAMGGGVKDVKVRDRVAALTQYGSHAEVIYWNANELVPVPESLDPAEVVPLILNYLVAYQILHRVAKVKEGDKVLIIGASGGVGTAFLQLGGLAGLKMYGLASPSKHPILADYGATPIDYHTHDFVEVLRQAEPEGIDYVFNGMGEETFERALAVLRRGGILVHYGAPQSLAHFVLLVAKLLLYNLMPNGKTIEGYGTHRLGVDLFKEDWTALFKLLEEGKIKPILAGKYRLLEAVKAYRLLESGQVTGNLVLLAPELL
ncbi:MAG TPA: medium chain dehydrogenase/reductase family protein [Anaerolineales bacterium]|nr:medium chain dehydrogenase/reductase family protein [Anaerolineales bacterium]